MKKLTLAFVLAALAVFPAAAQADGSHSRAQVTAPKSTSMVPATMKLYNLPLVTCQRSLVGENAAGFKTGTDDDINVLGRGQYQGYDTNSFDHSNRVSRLTLDMWYWLHSTVTGDHLWKFRCSDQNESGQVASDEDWVVQRLS